MSKKYNHEDKNVNGEFDEVYKKTDLSRVDEEQPQNPRVGMQWYQPSTDTLKIYNGTAWFTH